MSHTAGLGRSVGALLLWAASALPAAASVDQAQLERALALGQGKGAGSIDVYVGGSLAGSSGPRTKRYDLKSTTKSFGGLLLCLALKDGKVALSDPGAKYVADFGQPSTAAARGVTLGQLASHTAGFDKPGGFVPVRYAPGSAFAYSDGGANWLADVLTSAYHQDLAALFRDRIGSRIGAPVGWRGNAYRPPTLDGVPRREFGSGVSADVDAMARVGDALLPGGPLAGCARLLGTTPAGLRGLPIRTPFTPGASRHYGLLWWNNGDGAIAGVPRDAFWSWGLGESLILVVPSKRLVVSRAGHAWQAGWRADYRVLAPFFQAVSAAVR